MYLAIILNIKLNNLLLIQRNILLMIEFKAILSWTHKKSAFEFDSMYFLFIFYRIIYFMALNRLNCGLIIGGNTNSIWF